MRAVWSGWSVWRWAVSSHDRAVDNARAAATECSRQRLERAEVAEFLTAYVEPAQPRAEEA